MKVLGATSVASRIAIESGSIELSPRRIPWSGIGRSVRKLAT